ncbi:MAG: DEAD/DEAH box helicase [Nitrospirales bacterium]|nr:DEAD/DEAH box helicase [Nitrospira sp.]MDR4500147.1 DEAD/DEAH box helicase [Nitrospirales bacterium]
MSDEPPYLLQKLKALPPNHLYALAPKDYILRGYDYYSRERLESYRWNADYTVLTAYVRGSQQYAVQLSEQGAGLQYTCTCPAWSSSNHCKHVICALLTTINILSPETFSLPGNTSAHRDKLQERLLPHASLSSAHLSLDHGASHFEVVLSDHEKSASLTIQKQGVPCRSFYGIPTELTLLMRGTLDPAWMAHENFLGYLEQHGNAHQLIFATPEERIPLTWRPSLHYRSATELDLKGDQIEVSARCLLHGAVQEHARPFQRLIVNLEAQTISPLEDSHGWDTYTLIGNVLEEERWLRPRDSRPPRTPPRIQRDAYNPASDVLTFGSRSQAERLCISLEIFNRLHLNFISQTEVYRDLILKVRGKTVSSSEFTKAEHRHPPLTYRLSILSYDDERAPIQANLREPLALLQPEVRLGSQNLEPHASTFQAIPFIEQARELPPAFRSQKRKTIMWKTFFQLLGTTGSTEAHRLINNAMSADEFQAYAIKSEAKHILKEWHAAYREEDFRLACTTEQWHLISNEKAQQALLYAIPYEIFGHRLFKNMIRHDQMSLPHATLHAQLPDLHAKLLAAGIELRYHDKPILTSKWEFSVTAQRPPDIDWFEIRPEITCDGVVVSESTWRDAIQKGTVSETDEGIRIVDVNAMEVLRSIFSLLPGSKPGKDKHKKPSVVRVPTLQILDWIVLRKHGVNIVLPKDDEAIFERLLNFEKIETIPLPQHLQIQLRTYQTRGYQWLSFLYQHRFGACLADDMGLGKTLQAISLLAGIHEGLMPNESSSAKPPGPHLIVLPPTLLFNWEHEITRFYPTFRIRWYSGKERSTDFTDCDIVLTTYGIVRRDIEILAKHVFHVIIFDEAQAVKNITAHSTGAARRLNGRFKLAMTGTPLENHLGEYYSIIDLCLPGLLGEYDDFRSQMKSHEPPMLEQLLRRTKPFVLRRTKAETLQELPPKIETDVYLDLTDRQKSLYQHTVAQIRPTIEDAYRTKTTAQARVIALTAILKLRQICLSPKLLQPTSTESSPKITCLLDRLHELLDEGHSALVFSQFTSFLDLVEQEFQSHHLPYSRLDGSTPTKTRKTLVQNFQEDPQPSVFLLSLKAGGQGLNLTKASYVFHLDPWWNPAVENQASDRAHRIGQQQQVSIMRFLMHHTIEEKMMELKQHKLALYDAIMEGSTQRGAGAGITKEDFDFLLS